MFSFSLLNVKMKGFLEVERVFGTHVSRDACIVFRERMWVDINTTSLPRLKLKCTNGQKSADRNNIK